MNKSRIAAALRELAAAIEEPDVASPAEKAKPARKPKKDPVQDNTPAEDDQPFEVELSDLQELGANLIKAGKKPALLDLIAEMGGKSLSGIPKEKWGQAHLRMVGLTRTE